MSLTKPASIQRVGATSAFNAKTKRYFSTDPDAYVHSECNCPPAPCWAYFGEVPLIDGSPPAGFAEDFSPITAAFSGVQFPCSSCVGVAVDGWAATYTIRSLTASVNVNQVWNVPITSTGQSIYGPFFYAEAVIGTFTGSVVFSGSGGYNPVPPADCVTAPTAFTSDIILSVRCIDRSHSSCASKPSYLYGPGLTVAIEGTLPAWVGTGAYSLERFAVFRYISRCNSAASRFSTFPNDRQSACGIGELITIPVNDPGTLDNYFYGAAGNIGYGGTATVARTTAAILVGGHCLPDDDGTYP